MKTLLLFCLLLLTAFPAPIHVDLDNDVIAVPHHNKYSPRTFGELPDLNPFSDARSSPAMAMPWPISDAQITTPICLQAGNPRKTISVPNTYCHQSPILRI